MDIKRTYTNTHSQTHIFLHIPLTAGNALANACTRTRTYTCTRAHVPSRISAWHKSDSFQATTSRLQRWSSVNAKWELWSSCVCSTADMSPNVRVFVLETIRVCCFVLLKQYWGIVMYGLGASSWASQGKRTHDPRSPTSQPHPVPLK